MGDGRGSGSPGNTEEEMSAEVLQLSCSLEAPASLNISEFLSHTPDQCQYI